VFYLFVFLILLLNRPMLFMVFPVTHVDIISVLSLIRTGAHLKVFETDSKT